MTATAPAPRLQRLDGLRILVVEDDPDARTRASLVLAQAGASVQTVTSAREALHVLAEDRPDALVSDIDLSGEDGYALIQRIRQHEATHGGFLPAVALSGYARAAARARTLAAGFQVQVVKPVEPAAFTAAIVAVTAPCRHDDGWTASRQSRLRGPLTLPDSNNHAWGISAKGCGNFHAF